MGDGADKPRRTEGRGLLRLGVVALALAALGLGLWFGLEARGPEHMAQASDDSGVSSVTSSPALPAVTATSPQAAFAAQMQPLPPAAAGWLSASPRAGSRALRAPILTYHYVDAFSKLPVGPWAKRLTISVPKFKQEMDYLVANGYHSVTLKQIYDAVTGSELLPAKPVALTFDDGGADNYTTAFPILRLHRLVATFFVVTAVVGKPGYMSWAQLRAMSRAGMAIESHTVHHWDLVFLDSAKLQAELVQSRVAIISHLGLGADYLAYPGGDCDQRVMAAVQTAGYRAAFTDEYGAAGDLIDPQAVYDWPRAGIGPQETLTLFKKALGGTTPPGTTGSSANSSGSLTHGAAPAS